MIASARALSATDAFFIACLPGALGPSLVNRAIGALISQTRIDDELSQAVRRAAQMIEISSLQADSSHKILVETCAQVGLHLPERPENATDFEKWLEEVRAIVRRNITTPENSSAMLAFFEAGAAAGDLHLCLFVGRNLMFLRTAAPQHRLLAQAAENVARTLLRAKHRLVKALRHAAFSAPAAAFAERIDALFLASPDLATATTAEAFAAFDGFATQAATLIEELGATLAPS